MLREFTDNLIGKCPPVEFCDKIKNIALSFTSVSGVHDVEIHSYGRNKVISLHIELSPQLSLREAHSIADSIEKKINTENLGRCIVHVDLTGKAKTTQKEIVEKAIIRFIAKNKEIKDFHGLEIIVSEAMTIVDFIFVFSRNTSLEESHSISHKLSIFLKNNSVLPKLISMLSLTGMRKKRRLGGEIIFLFLRRWDDGN
jgi:divalent metal cation (Fe/Co/Zn/Cd) transporter